MYKKIPDALLLWYHRCKRDLPWREDTEPYHIWLSEIMLQQTRVEAVKGYYARFLKVLPTIESLANADDELLHKLWEGLGYYSRVRNLKKAAQMVMQKYDGVFPAQYTQVRELPGIGEYTAGAICSIAFSQPIPAVDGNVLRVISRLTDDDTPIDLPAYKKTVKEALQRVYPKEAGEFTQALMELGATVCGPNREPDCPGCPCKGFCLGYANGREKCLPVKKPKKTRRIEARTVFILRCGDCYALEKRPNNGLLADLWQFPNVQGKLELEDALSFVSNAGLRPTQVHRQLERKHIFTHIVWQMRGIYLTVKNKNQSYVWMTSQQINTQAALPTAFRQFWEEAENV
ncbi:MAG: A/G-specific adenine glycosylase [Oscillospiraceae bacterium]|nr:A/G-specific adenine glycosylase [Oscillospiraceae bacterium]